MKKIHCVFIAAIFIVGCDVKPLGDYPPNPKAGKCYAKCMKADGGYDVWKEVICANKITVPKLLEIQKALRAAGFECGTDVTTTTVDADFKKGIQAYQKSKNLSTGALDIDTLNSLGIKY
jgi:Putative peptidoglycan binding domain